MIYVLAMERVQELILSIGSDDQAVSRNASRTLVGCGCEAAADIIEALPRIPLAKVDRLLSVILRWPVEKAIECLVQMLDEHNFHIAVRVVRAIGSTHCPAAVMPLARMLDRPLRHAAVVALGENGSAEGLVPLRQLLERLIDGAVDVSAIDNNDLSTAELVAAVVQALGRLGEDGDSYWLTAILRYAQEPAAREAAAIALRDVPVADALTALAGGLTDPISNVRNSSLLTLWSYRTAEAIDSVFASESSDSLVFNIEAMLYDVAALDVSVVRADLMRTWSQCRTELASATCLLAGSPITVNALVGRVRASVRAKQALDDLALFYGLRLCWDQQLDEQTALIEEVESWSREVALRFVPGRMYRFGREVPSWRLPRAH